jgi:hypothetical protein
MLRENHLRPRTFPSFEFLLAKPIFVSRFGLLQICMRLRHEMRRQKLSRDILLK